MGRAERRERLTPFEHPTLMHGTPGFIMITIYLRYVLDTSKLKEFEHYGKLWIPLVEKFGGRHHGYFMPGEGANNIALALFTFDSLTAYESYRLRSFEDPDCQAAFRYAEETRCIISYERSFFRPVFS
jgi:hypothetical protein